jgi:hypothetical protein
MREDQLQITCDALAASLSEKLFDGQLPDKPEVIAWSVARCMLEMFPGKDYRSIEWLADNLTVALSHRIAIEKEKRREPN